MYYYFELTVLSSIQRKLIGTLLFVMMVPLIIFMLISTQISKETVESSEISSNKSRVELAGSYLEDQIGWYDEFLFDALVDSQLVPSISSVEDINSVNIFNRQSYIKDKIFSLLNERDHTISASLVSFEEKQLYKVESNEFFIFPYLYSPVLPQDKEAILIVDRKTETFSLERYIYRFEDQKAVGKIQINVSFSFIDQVAENLKSNEGEHILLLDSEGNELYNPDLVELTNVFRGQLADQVEKGVYVDEENYYFIHSIMDDRLTILKMVPKEVMLTGAVYIGQSGLLILFISMILTVVLSLIVSNQVAKPIVSLTKAMENIEESGFRVDMKEERTDEIGVLYRKYKEMIDRIRELIETNYKREMETRDAQFLALQAQINPHFLYNTLQVIGGMAVKNGAVDIYSMTQKLASMFRYIINKRKGLVPLHEEITHLKNYLYIQQVRFKEKVVVQLFIDKSINDEAMIPLLSLQPLIENSFKHGFETKVSQCIIKIDIQKIFDEIEITIEDNGAGMSEERLLEVKKILQQEGFSEQRSIGLKNVDARIKLYFGREYGIEIESKNFHYTKLIILIPLK